MLKLKKKKLAIEIIDPIYFFFKKQVFLDYEHRMIEIVYLHIATNSTNTPERIL